MPGVQNIRYGQIVRIHGNYKENHPFRGLITSKGFTNSSIYYEIYHNFSCIANYRQSLFEILPKSSFDIHDQMKNLPENKREESRAKTEKQQFESAINTKRGQIIYFGNQIIIRHLDSGSYVQSSYQCAKSGIGAFKLSLTNELSSQVIFKIMPYRTYQKEGDQICIGDPILIYDTKTHCYLSFQTDQEIFLDKKFNHKREIFYQELVIDINKIRPWVKKNPGKVRYELINQNTPKRIWKIQKHLDNLEISKEVIIPHDLVYFIHTKDNRFMTPFLLKDRVTLKIQNQRYPQTANDYFQAIWQIQPLSFQTQQGVEEQFEPQILMKKKKEKSEQFIFIQKSKTENRKGKYQKGDQNKQLILRHFSSGRLLIYDPTSKEAIIQEKNKTNIKRQIRVEPCAKLKSGDLINLEFEGFKLDVKKQELKKKELQKISIIRGGIKKLTRISEFHQAKTSGTFRDQIRKVNYEKLQFSKQMKEHSFRIVKTQHNIKKQLLYVISTHELLAKFNDLLMLQDKKQIEQMVSNDLLMDVINTLKQIKGFIYQCDYQKIEIFGSNL